MPTLPNSLPRHIAVIMDGNGRWARQRQLPRIAGHRAGARSAREIVERAGRSGIEVLTLFAFSSENWQRPEAEVSGLMDLFMRTIRKELPDLNRNRVRVSFIGERQAFGSTLQADMAHAESVTKDNDGLHLLIAVGFGGRWDIAMAARRLAERVASGEITPESIDAETLGEATSLDSIPDPDLLIRTGGEQRISNFLLWHMAYTELYFTGVLWPDFGEQEFAQALDWYADRDRRFGRVAHG